MEDFVKIESDNTIEPSDFFEYFESKSLELYNHSLALTQSIELLKNQFTGKDLAELKQLDAGEDRMQAAEILFGTLVSLNFFNQAASAIQEEITDLLKVLNKYFPMEKDDESGREVSKTNSEAH